MVSVSRTFRVDTPLSTVVDYLKDFGNAVEWDPGTQLCERTDSGPVAVGATWRNVSKFLGRESELTYRLDRLEADHLRFVGSNETVTSYDDMAFRSDGSGTELTYHVDLRLKGAAKLGAPVVRLAFERLASRTQQQLEAVLSAL